MMNDLDRNCLFQYLGQGHYNQGQYLGQGHYIMYSEGYSLPLKSAGSGFFVFIGRAYSGQHDQVQSHYASW